jgi:phenylalanyl-tRNA synthetase beta chain
MKVPVEWVNRFLSKSLQPKAMADAMELAGIEVESISQGIKLDSNIVTGLVLSVKPHPNADRLQIAQVDVNKTTLSIVCGASNLKKGQKVVVAKVGAKLPDGTEITEAKLRGESSQGMICSTLELQIDDDHSGILVLPEKTNIGVAANSILDSNAIIDVATAANRWDLNSIIGLARETAAHSGQNLSKNYPEQLSSSELNLSSKKLLKAKVEKADLASRYTLAHLRVDGSKPSPTWLSQRLLQSGIRPISLIVDVTNYIMIEYGQPLHAFDADKVAGEILVRNAVKGEKLTTLDGVKRNLTSDDIVIADNSRVIGYAGVMGGANSEIDGSTTSVYLEAASFNPAALRRTAQRNGLRTDASARFERGIPADLPPKGLAAAIRLLQEITEVEILSLPADIITKSSKGSVTKVTISIERISKFLGIKLDSKSTVLQLASLGFSAESSGINHVVSVPWWRPDITLQEDIAEEIIKLVGYDKLPATIPSWSPSNIRFDSHYTYLWRAKSVLRSAGLFEVTTYSFIGEDQISDLGWDIKDFLKLRNPLSREQGYLRRDLLPSFIAVAARNRNYSKQAGFYEFSKVYRPKRAGQLPDEQLRLAVMTVGANSYTRLKAILDRLAGEYAIKLTIIPTDFDKQVMYAGRAAHILSGKHQIGTIAQLHPILAQRHKLSQVSYLEIAWEELMESSGTKTYHDPGKYPSITRDISFVVDRKITWQQVEIALKDYQVDFINDYYGDDLPKSKKAVAIRATFKATDHTLTDAEADSKLRFLVKALKRSFTISLR